MPRAGRGWQVSALLLAVTFGAMALGAVSTSVVLGLALLVVAILSQTGAEIIQTASAWTLAFAFADESRRATDLAAFNLGVQTQALWGPLALAAIITRPSWMWGAAVVLVVASTGVRPSLSRGAGYRTSIAVASWTHVLVLATRRTEPVQRLLELSTSVTVVAAQAHAGAYVASGVPVLIVPDFAHPPAMSAAARQAVDARGSLTGIVTTSESGIVPAALLRAAFGVPGDDLRTAITTTHKAHMKRAWTDLPVAGWREVQRWDDIDPDAWGWEWPVVVKPSAGSGTTGTVLVHHRGEIPSAAAKVGPVAGSLIVEQYLAVKHELHVDALVDGGRMVFSTVSRYNTSLLTGLGGALGSVVLPDHDAAVAGARELARRAVEDVGVTTGVVHVELFDTGGRLVLGEMAARPGGGGIVRTIELATGVDLWRALAELAPGREPRLPVRPTPDLRMARNARPPRHRRCHTDAG